MRKTVILFFILAIIFQACTTFKLEPANFAWPVENVLTPDKDGNVKETRYSLEFNIKKLFINEFPAEKNSNFSEIRIIRNSKGFYFMTAEGFQNVYVFTMEDGAFNLFRVIKVTETELRSPAFNQRAPFIELLFNNGNSLKITEKGLEGGMK